MKLHGIQKIFKTVVVPKMLGIFLLFKFEQLGRNDPSLNDYFNVWRDWSHLIKSLWRHPSHVFLRWLCSARTWTIPGKLCGQHRWGSVRSLIVVIYVTLPKTNSWPLKYVFFYKKENSLPTNFFGGRVCFGERNLRWDFILCIHFFTAT